MDVMRITPRGYCHGVVDAFRIAKQVRESTGGPVYMLGQLVHNTHATDELQEQGIALVDPPNRLAGLEGADDFMLALAERQRIPAQPVSRTAHDHAGAKMTCQGSALHGKVEPALIIATAGSQNFPVGTRQ